MTQTVTWPTLPLKFLFVLFTITSLAIAADATASGPVQDGAAESNEPAEGGIQPYEWSRDLPNGSCPWANSNGNCHRSSPTLADINGDGRLDIVLATNNGHVVAVRHDGQVLWERDIAPAFGMSGGTHEIASSPAVGDLDGDGKPEVVVGTGSIYKDTCTQGGMIVLDHNGHVKSGWPYLAEDGDTGPSGCRDTIFSSPALGDLDNDGTLEIVAGGFDKRIYAWHDDGSLVPGFPPSSYHRQQLSDWDDLIGKLGDTIWSSPVLADLDGDGYLDIIIGTDEGNVGGDWECPYTLPPGWQPGYCGGSIYALDRFGKLLPGFPRYIHETIQSTPAIADLNNDGSPDIVVGTGSFYYNNSPDHPTDGFRLYVMDSQARDLPGWEGGKWVGGPVPASPSIGDINGDGNPEIVVGVMEKREIHAYRTNGEMVNGFPAKPVDQYGQTLSNYGVGSSIVLADYDGDGRMEIILNQGWVVSILDNNGSQITAPSFPAGDKPIYYTDGSLLNNPAVGDLDGDGKLELIAHNSKLYVWELPGASVKSDWPMFKKDAAGLGYVPMPPRLAPQDDLYIVHDINNSGPATVQFDLLNAGDGRIEWSATTPNHVSLSPSSGSFRNSQTVQVTINTSNLNEGQHNLGEILVTARSDNQEVAGSPMSIPVLIHLDEFENVFLPFLKR
ncbi:MAG TPA: VCBS repeat-containing protein [Candidatus Sulfomarinibacteraceae bacterium]|nr:VCBS repeat-containing protein [Candidatus Sulfomarinibacteraceae bacterium]